MAGISIKIGTVVVDRCVVSSACDCGMIIHTSHCNACLLDSQFCNSLSVGLLVWSQGKARAIICSRPGNDLAGVLLNPGS
jgi:hypothetical protein